MRKPQIITMTMRELDRLKIILALADGYLKTGIAASRLGLTARQRACCGATSSTALPAYFIATRACRAPGKPPAFYSDRPAEDNSSQRKMLGLA